MKKFFSKLFTTKKYLIAFILGLVLIATSVAVVLVVTLNKDEPSDSSSSSSGEEQTTTFTVSFETNGGSAIAPVTVEQGDSINVGEYLTEKENYYFYSWCLDQELTDRVSMVYTPTADTKLYAEWGAEEKYLLSFETGDGTPVEAVLYKPNAYLVAPQEPTRENYAFGGWYSDEACTRPFNFFGFTMPRRNVTVYAKWTQLFTLHFDSKGGSAVASVSGNVGDRVVVAAPERTDYIFDGWYFDEAYQKPCQELVIPNQVTTVYAKWHEQRKNINVTLHLNHAEAAAATLSVTGNEGEDFDAEDAIADFYEKLATAVLPSFIDQTVDLEETPLYNFAGWTYSANGGARYDGKLTHNDGALDLYAVWTRSSAYCKVTFLGETAAQDVSYYVEKNTVIDDSILQVYETPLQTQYQSLGCEVDGFYTVAGERYVSGQKLVKDMKLLPYLSSVDLEYKFMGVYNASGSVTYGYAVQGYKSDSTVATKDKDSLLLIVPEYYQGEQGSYPVIWVSDNAFKDYPVTEVRLPERIMAIGKSAFAGTKLTSVTLPKNLFKLDDSVFANCTTLQTVTFSGSSISWLGTRVFAGTPYETTLTRENGFVYFNSAKTILYSYEGTSSSILETPQTVMIIAGGAFKDNTSITMLTLRSSVRLVCDGAFENCQMTQVTLGKNLTNIGANVFKNCTRLTRVVFENKDNITYLGEGMFQGCTALEEIDLSKLTKLQEIRANAFNGCTELSKVLLAVEVEEDVETEEITSVIDVIGDYAFANCTSLTELVFPESLEEIGAHAFENTSLTAISLPTTLGTIGAYAFANCSGLTTLDIPFSVTEVGESAFENCTNLFDVEFGRFGKVEESDDDPQEIISLLRNIGNRAFANCTALKRIIFNSELYEDAPVAFGENVLLNAGNGETVIYVCAGAPAYSATSQWKNGNVMYSYVEIYQSKFTGTEYASVTVKAIERIAPVLTVTSKNVTLTTNNGLKTFDALAYFQTENAYTVTDNVSNGDKCTVRVAAVKVKNGAEETELVATEGKYNISAVGVYLITLEAADECGNVTQTVVEVRVTNS